MNNYLELAQLSDGTIVLRRSDDKENPLVKIKFSGESKQLLQGQELHIAKEMIRAGIESISGNVSDFDLPYVRRQPSNRDAGGDCHNTGQFGHDPALAPCWSGFFESEIHRAIALGQAFPLVVDR